MSWNGYPSYVCNVILRKNERRTQTDTVLILKIMTLQRFGFESLTLVLLERNLPKNCISKLRKCSKKELKFILSMIRRKLRSSSLTRTLYLLICSHTSYINLNVPDVRRNILGTRTDVLN